MEVDFIIVGAGSAGCALAGRLSEDASKKVALIEAGGRDSNPWIHIPVGYFKTLDNPKTDWCYRTEPDRGLNGRSIKWPRGRVLGGSSSINGLLYVRGQPQDYDRWRQLGNSGWGWDEVMPVFRRIETWEGGGTDERGESGPLSVSRSRLSREIVDDWQRAALAAGYRENKDYNSGDQEGVSPFQLTMRNGLRCSAAVAYLNPARSRENLVILTGRQTRKLILRGGRAVGVVVSRGGVEETITARREVILSAGAIGSPQILMNSGIGDPEVLSDAGVATEIALPGVGKNLQDHLQARPVFKCTATTINTQTRSLLRRIGMAAEFAVRRTGPMTMAASLGAAFLKTRPDLETPDIQFHIQPFSADSPTEGPHPFDAFTASVCVLRPESTGELRITSPDPMAHPAIHPNYLATQTDCDAMVEGIKIARRIAKHAPLVDKVTGEHSPGSSVGEDDDAAILDWIRNTATTIYHPTGTCKMGPATDKAAVVDSRLRVHGIEGLRVADASIMPQIVSGNTNAPAIMIGERASDFIKEDTR
ncbi:GMC family oxidoreductase N-terminal domain-containing protein [Rhodobacteraceae bacterium NNCM2]|nr:GMC family oxidoreductase N-terminal domain-containing protein [Coraliihabitans acroporae]